MSEILKDIVQDNNRASEVIRHMRALVKKEQLELAQLNLAGVIGDVVALIHSEAILHSIGVELDLAVDLPMARGDKIQLQQVVLNLLLNAFDAIGLPYRRTNHYRAGCADWQLYGGNRRSRPWYWPSHR